MPIGNNSQAKHISLICYGHRRSFAPGTLGATCTKMRSLLFISAASQLQSYAAIPYQCCLQLHTMKAYLKGAYIQLRTMKVCQKGAYIHLGVGACNCGVEEGGGRVVVERGVRPQAVGDVLRVEILHGGENN